MEVTVKAYLKRSEAETEVRRVSMKLPSDAGFFKIMVTKVTAAFPSLSLPAVTLAWQDSDGDLVVMSSDEELREALAECGSSVLKVFISENVDKNKEEAGETEQRTGPEVSRPDFDREMLPKHEGKVRPCPQKTGDDSKSCHQKTGDDSKSCHQKTGDTSSAQACGRPCSGRMGNRRHPEHHDGEETEGHAWKKALREAVPVSHRRWAKMYIHNWRKNNTKSATATSSFSDTERKGKGLTKELAGVPEAYMAWLDMVLPRFHQSWEENLNNDWSSWDEGIERESDSHNMIKMSVPVEFRKWVWWFLTKRHGKRSAPQTKRETSCEKGQKGSRGRQCGRNNKEEDKAKGKMHHIASQIPLPVRRWAKGIIQTWRAEHQLPTTKCGNTDQVKVTAQDAGVPEEYGAWLLKCLARWHMWRGLVDRKDVDTPREGMGQFKDTVPNEFRVWAKCYLCKQFGQKQEKQENQGQTKCGDKGIVGEGEMDQYQKWLQIFKQKWVTRQQEVTDEDQDSSEGQDASSDDSANTDMEVDTLFKCMKLDAGMGAKHGSDESDSERECGLTTIRKSYPGFPKLARSVLSSWDGASIEGPQPDGATELPAHVYRWLSSVMVRVQVRKMVRVHKAARKESKLARREIRTKSKQQDNA